MSDIVVIGAGIGGVSAAIRLAVAGHNVTILEKNEQVGGKMGQVTADGFRWDTGPSVITMRHVFEELFASAGRNLNDYITLLPVDPLTRYFYPNGKQIDIVRDWAEMADQLVQLEDGEREVEGYLAYLQYVAQLHRITGDVFIYDRPPTPKSFLRVPFPDWFKVDAWRTMDGKIRSFVKSPELRQLFGRFATYVGGSPYHAPATLNVIAHVELTGGVYYPQGGIYQIAAGMERLARELGVRVNLNVNAKINVEEGRIHEVVADDGRVWKADAVVSNVDVATTYRDLLPDGVGTKTLRRLKRLEPSCSGFVLLLGVRGVHDKLAHHNIWFSDDYPAEFDAIFKRQIPAENPTIYAAITSKTDADHAPEGHENWFILVNAPPVSERVDWDAYAPVYRDVVLARLAEHGIDLRDKIVHEHLLTPVDLVQNTGAWRGALYGASANKMMTAFMRPHNRCPDVRGLYFAGGTTHPGGGVPMVTLSGKVAAELLLEDLAERL